MPSTRSVYLTRLRPVAAVALVLLSACSHGIVPQFKPPVPCRTVGPAEETLFLIGDAGAPSLPDEDDSDPGRLIDPVLVALRTEVSKSVAERSADRTGVIVLGDNVYPAGMPPSGEPGHERAARILDAQVAAIGDARGWFTLGNHDWDQGNEGGWRLADAQLQYLSSRAPNISVMPGGTCPGPEAVNFGDHFYLTFFDVWAAVYQIEHPDGPQTHCTPTPGEGRLAAVLDRMLDDHAGRRTVFVAHPPMITSGPHGGYFPWGEHLFPLRVFNRDLWIPVPIIGSIFPIARMLGVTDTDLTSGQYRAYIEALMRLFAPGHPTLVAAGHEHSLQVHVDPTGTFHAVSGAGSVSKVDYVRDMKSDLMSLAAPGFMRVDAYADGTLRLGVIALSDDHEHRLVYSTCIP
jgi:hypothetical protein